MIPSHPNRTHMTAQDRYDPNLLPDTRMTFGEHLDELRRRLIKAICGLAVALAFCLYFGAHIFAFLARPLLIALQAAGVEPALYVASLPESFLAYFKVACYAALFLASPWIFYQLWAFVAAGLYPHEKRYVLRFLPFSAGLFLLGGAFFVFAVAPVTCNFFIRFGMTIKVPRFAPTLIDRTFFPQVSSPAPAPAEPNTTASAPPPAPQPLIKPWFTLQSYVSFILLMGLAFGLAFQLPLIVFFLGRLRLVSLAAFRSHRRHVILGIIIAAAIITPTPDIATCLALAVPMYLLYELGLVLLRLWPPRAA